MAWLARLFWGAVALLVFFFAALAVNQEQIALAFIVWETPSISVFWWLLAAFTLGLLLGLLGITVLGLERFEIISTRILDNGLTMAKFNILDESDEIEIPEQFYYMQELLEHISAQDGKVETENQRFSEMMYALIFLLPLDTNLKQRLLEIPLCSDRALILHAELIRLGVIQYIKPDLVVEK